MAVFDGPAFLRPAGQVERDVAGSAQRRFEASLQTWWVDLASASGPDWWERLVPTHLRARARKHADKDGGPTDPGSLVRRLTFMDLVELFRTTFPAQFAEIFQGTPFRIQSMLLSLDDARDAAAHTGKPYMAAEAQLATAVARQCAIRIPPAFHDPTDLLVWFEGLTFGENEGFRTDSFDCGSDAVLLDGAFWSDLHRLIRSFRNTLTTGDKGFSAAVENLITQRGLDLFIRAGELTMGTGLPAFSGLFHEHDLGVRGKGQAVILELKNYPRSRVGKNDIMLFNQKTIDFQLSLVQANDKSRLIRAFATTDTRVSDAVRGFCLQWGILLVEPSLLPIPSAVAAMRDLEGTEVSTEPEFEINLERAERLAAFIRPLDNILVPSSLSRWRLLLDASSLPQVPALTALVRDHHAVDAYLQRIASEL